MIWIIEMVGYRIKAKGRSKSSRNFACILIKRLNAESQLFPTNSESLFLLPEFKRNKSRSSTDIEFTHRLNPMQS